ncbi:MAG: M14 family zinc carboxypeptidase, partial [Saprospiraceae bacterium]
RSVQLLRENGFEVKILEPDVQAAFLNAAARFDPRQSMSSSRGINCTDQGVDVLQKWQTPQNYTYGSMGGYHTYSELMTVLDDMADKFPNLISVRAPLSPTLLTFEGRPVYWVRISDNPLQDEPEPEVLYTALHHAREPNSMSQMLFFMWYVLEHYETDASVKQLLNETELYFVPCLNPDGYVYNETISPMGGGFWRKNRRDSIGVDLNRNYSFQWGMNGASASPLDETYRGESPFSEPETQMIRDFSLTHDFRFVLNYHTSGDYLLCPWGFQPELADSAFQQYGKVMIKENNYTFGPASTVLYLVSGGSDDWHYGELGNYALTPEVGYSFWPNPQDIDKLNKDNVWANLFTALSAWVYFNVEDVTDENWDSIPDKLLFEVQRLGQQQGALTVRVRSLSPQVQTDVQQTITDLALFEKKNFVAPISLQSALYSGDTLSWEVVQIVGNSTTTDTIQHVYLGNSINLYANDFDNLNDWVGDWQLTNSVFWSAPSSLTDSPDDLYPAFANSILFKAEEVFIPEQADDAVLTFKARWEIEEDFDFVQVIASGGASGDVPLCGRYTGNGTIYQLENEPLYDGFEPNWVSERMGLSAFKGESILIWFVLRSDEIIQYDGFYVDDMRIEYYLDGILHTQPLGKETFILHQNAPNPVEGQTVISWNPNASAINEATLVVYNALGQVAHKTLVDVNDLSCVLNTQHWPAGVYTYQLIGATWHSKTMQMMIH